MFQVVEQYGKSSCHLSLSVLLVILVASVFKFISRPRSPKLNLPPSPLRIPIIGNLYQLGSLPQQSLASLAQKHGPVMMVHFGQKQVVVVSSAEVAGEMMKTQDLIFSSRPSVSATERQFYSNKNLAFSPCGDYWRQLRKITVVRLLTSAKVRSFRSVREEEVNHMIAKIRQSCTSGSSVVNLSEIVMSFTFHVVCRVAFGRKFEGEVGGSNQFLKMIADFMYLLGAFNVGDFIPWLSWVNNFNGLNSKIEENVKNLDCFLERVIEEHVQLGKNGKSDGPEVQDFVDVLLGVEKDKSLGIPFARDNIKALLLGVFIPGTETSSSNVIWAMTELMKHPEIMNEVQREIREISNGKPIVTEEDLAKMHYLKMVIKETLRLHTQLMPRKSTTDTKLQGYHIPAKTTVLINSWAIGRDPKLWEEPEEFRPKRFSYRSLDYNEPGFGLIPFGGGRRACPGVAFAVPNMELPLANLLYHFDWNLPDGAMTVDVSETSGTLPSKKSSLLLAATLHSF